MPLNANGRYTWSRRELRAHHGRSILLVCAAWALLYAAMGTVIHLIITGGK
jgi:hypothetical protein